MKECEYIKIFYQILNQQINEERKNDKQTHIKSKKR
jgi:hypothetical protein